jgi:hypothetical protein
MFYIGHVLQCSFSGVMEMFYELHISFTMSVSQGFHIGTTIQATSENSERKITHGQVARPRPILAVPNQLNKKVLDDDTIVD